MNKQLSFWLFERRAAILAAVVIVALLEGGGYDVHVHVVEGGVARYGNVVFYRLDDGAFDSVFGQDML